MTRFKKHYGFRLGEHVPKWKDRLGHRGGKIIKLIYLKYCNKVQVLVSNGDILTSEYILQDDFFIRGLGN